MQKKWNLLVCALLFCVDFAIVAREVVQSVVLYFNCLFAEIYDNKSWFPLMFDEINCVWWCVTFARINLPYTHTGFVHKKGKEIKTIAQKVQHLRWVSRPAHFFYSFVLNSADINGCLFSAAIILILCCWNCYIQHQTGLDSVFGLLIINFVWWLVLVFLFNLTCLVFCAWTKTFIDTTCICLAGP